MLKSNEKTFDPADISPVSALAGCLAQAAELAGDHVILDRSRIDAALEALEDAIRRETALKLYNADELEDEAALLAIDEVLNTEYPIIANLTALSNDALADFLLGVHPDPFLDAIGEEVPTFWIRETGAGLPLPAFDPILALAEERLMRLFAGEGLEIMDAATIVERVMASLALDIAEAARNAGEDATLVAAWLEGASHLELEHLAEALVRGHGELAKIGLAYRAGMEVAEIQAAAKSLPAMKAVLVAAQLDLAQAAFLAHLLRAAARADGAMPEALELFLDTIAEDHPSYELASGLALLEPVTEDDLPPLGTAEISSPKVVSLASRRRV